ncbi:hypothetical protein [Planobispora longispora]|uniref:hypothetical protein n=1 Tax=Planobispora longispora TaxID=28887 RepID=UPI00361B2069
MREELSVRETWPLECLHCRHEWQEEYTVRRMTDGHGHDVVVWMRGEVPVQPPWAGTNCPGCDMDTVSVFPKGEYARRRAPASADFASPPVEQLYSPVQPRPSIPLY